MRILFQTPIMEYTTQGHILMALSLFVFIIGIMLIICSENFKTLFFGVFLFITSIVIFVKANDYKMMTGRYEYKVLMDDTVSFREIEGKYTIEKVDGLIYTIKDKE